MWALNSTDYWLSSHFKSLRIHNKDIDFKAYVEADQIAGLRLAHLKAPITNFKPVARLRTLRPYESPELIYSIFDPAKGYGGVFVPDQENYQLAGYLTGHWIGGKNQVSWLVPEVNTWIDNVIIAIALGKSTVPSLNKVLPSHVSLVDTQQIKLSEVPGPPKLYFPKPSVDPASIGDSIRHDGASLVLYTKRPDDPYRHYVLMAQRESWFAHGPNLWTFPGGLLDSGET